MNQLTRNLNPFGVSGESSSPTDTHLHYVLDLASKLEGAVKEMTARMSDAYAANAGGPRQAASVARRAAAQSVEQILHIREKRKSEFGEIFGDPAWDILIFLLWAHGEQLRMTVGNVCDGAGVPTTTGLRWIERLRVEGLVIIQPDNLDMRRKFVELSDSAVERLHAVLN